MLADVNMALEPPSAHRSTLLSYGLHRPAQHPQEGGEDNHRPHLPTVAQTLKAPLCPCPVSVQVPEGYPFLLL